jgi:hypothetical protein
MDVVAVLNQKQEPRGREFVSVPEFRTTPGR